MNSRWLQLLVRWNLKFQTVLRGRYARFDQLNRLLLIVSMILLIGNLFFKITSLRWISLLLLLLIYYRFFSKRIHPRLNENKKYLAYQQKKMKKRQFYQQRLKYRKDYRYFSCPHCRQKLRAPRGKGTINVTCSNCQEKFLKKV